MQSSPAMQSMLFDQAEKLGRKPYPILSSMPERAVSDWHAYAYQEKATADVVFFDLPGTMNSTGVISTLAALDYLLVPMKADRMVLESTLNFATTINDRLIATHQANIKGLYLFWNMVDRRERNRLFEIYEKGINQLGLQCLHTMIPMRSNFNKDLAVNGPIYRSTLFPPDRLFTKECGFDNLLDEVCILLKFPDHGQESDE